MPLGVKPNIPSLLGDRNQMKGIKVVEIQQKLTKLLHYEFTLTEQFVDFKRTYLMRFSFIPNFTNWQRVGYLTANI